MTDLLIPSLDTDQRWAFRWSVVLWSFALAVFAGFGWLAWTGALR